MTDKEKRIRSLLVAYKSVISLEDIDGVLSPLQQRHLRCENYQVSETRMDNGRKAFVKTDGKSSELTASSADKSGKKLARETESIVIVLLCEICEELYPLEKLIDHQLQRQKERENTKRRELKDTSF